MVSIKNLQAEVKFAAVFAVFAAVISPVIGLISGNDFPVVILRALIFAFVFGLIGYGSVTVIKKFIPEFYNAVFASGSTGVSENSAAGQEYSMESGAADYESGAEYSGADQESADDYGVPEDGEYAGETAGIPKNNYAEDALNNISGSNMGKHILEEKGMQFEPKLMAEAIRTMMSKDE